MTATATDHALLEALDFAPPCTATPAWHDDFGSGPAAWIMHLTPCCPARPAAKTVCDGCREAVLREPSGECDGCGTVFAPVRLCATLIKPLTP